MVIEARAPCDYQELLIIINLFKKYKLKVTDSIRGEIKTSKYYSTVVDLT